MIEYKDGLKACLFTLNGGVADFTSAWKDDQGKITNVSYVLQDARPYSHFAVLFNGIEQFMHTGKAPWPVERTLLTSGLVDECLQSLKDGGKRRETPHLAVEYKSDWNWIQPIAPAPERPYAAQ